MTHTIYYIYFIRTTTKKEQTMKKIIILIAILCSIGFCKCAVTKTGLSVDFSCKPSEYETKDVKHIDFVVYNYGSDKISHIIEETRYKDNSKIRQVYHKNINYNTLEKIISTASSDAIIEETSYIDKYGIVIKTEQRAIHENLIFLYSNFKKEYNL
jgi:hypothetical protein